jgi:L-threonylcarbamoyladenylate synthase
MSYKTFEFDREVARLLIMGGVGVLPTDTVYGLSAQALNKNAVEKVHKLKDRSEHKPFIILISNLEMLDLLSITQIPIAMVNKYWPGPLSVIMDAPEAPAWLSLGSQSLAIRLPAHKQLLALIDQVGPLVSTSANIENQPVVRSVSEAEDIFGDQLDFYVDQGPASEANPSTIVKFNKNKLEVLRHGDIKIND